MTKVTVGICAYNEVTNITKAIRSVYEQELSDFEITEVVVVSSGSTDGTDEAVSALCDQYDNLKLIRQNVREGKNSAINCLLENKNTDIVVILNADNILGPVSTLQYLLDPLKDETVGIVGGHPIPTNTLDTVAGVASHMIWIMHHYVSMSYPKIGELIAFRDIGTRLPLNTQSDEDILKMELEKSGYHSAYAPNAIVYNRGPETVPDFIKQRTRVNIGEYYVNKDHEDFYIATHDRNQLISALMGAVKELGKKPFKLSIAVCLELISRLKAKSYVAKNKGDISAWDPVKTTKKV